MYSRYGISLSFILSLAAAQKIQFDGRLPTGTNTAVLDATNNFFQTRNVVGQNLTFGKAVLLPNVQPSLFDSNTVPLEVTIR